MLHFHPPFSQQTGECHAMLYIWAKNVLSYKHKLGKALTVFQDKHGDHSPSTFSAVTHEHSSLLVTSERGGHRSAQITPYCKRECAADWIIQEKAKIALCPNHKGRDRAGHDGSEEAGKGEKYFCDECRRSISFNSLADTTNFWLMHGAAEISLNGFSRRRKQYRVCLVLTHPPILLHNIALIQMCHHAKAPHSQGPNPPPQPPTRGPPNRLIVVSQWRWCAVSPTEYASNLYKITTKTSTLNVLPGWFCQLLYSTYSMHNFHAQVCKLWHLQGQAIHKY